MPPTITTTLVAFMLCHTSFQQSLTTTYFAICLTIANDHAQCGLSYDYAQLRTSSFVLQLRTLPHIGFLCGAAVSSGHFVGSFRRVISSGHFVGSFRRVISSGHFVGRISPHGSTSSLATAIVATINV
jgi:hypothetical protein